VTSQILANIYLNELDQFIKHQLKIKYYFRYADDFIIVHNNPDYLKDQLAVINSFLENNLALQLHADKVSIRKFRQGVDFLGYVILPHYKILRTKTKRRMFKKIFKKQELWLSGRLDEEKFQSTRQSYLGLLKHCQGYELECVIKNSSSRHRPAE